jgi:integrase
MKVQMLVKEYIEAQKLRWSESTKRSEWYRLKNITLGDLEDPQAYYEARRRVGRGPYTLKTEVVRIGEFYEWLREHGYIQLSKTGNPWKEFLYSHAKLFKHAYEKETLDVTFEQAVDRIQLIEREDIRLKAMQLLTSGMRFAESQTVKRGRVVGKGGKPAPVFIPPEFANVKYDKSYFTLWRELKKVGLKPHTLRKLLATHFVEQGGTLPDLMKLMRWESVETAASYLQGKQDSTLQRFVEGVTVTPKKE